MHLSDFNPNGECGHCRTFEGAASSMFCRLAVAFLLVPDNLAGRVALAQQLMKTLLVYYTNRMEVFATLIMQLELENGLVLRL